MALDPKRDVLLHCGKRRESVCGSRKFCGIDGGELLSDEYKVSQFWMVWLQETEYPTKRGLNK